jgi:YidC/Oxa1 family membrane protein insertase
LPEYHNPQQDPSDLKRLLLIFLLTFIGIGVMQYMMPKPAPQPQPKPAPQQQQQQSPTPAPPVVAKPPSGAAQNTPARQAASETTTVVENDLYRVTFSNKGGLVRSWVLKKFKNDKGQPLDIVNPVTAPVLGYPLSLHTFDTDLAKKLNEALYIPSATGELAASGSLSFEYADADTHVRKTFKFEKSTYVIGVETEVTNKDALVQAYPQWPGGFGDQTVLSSYNGSRIDWLQNDSVTRKPAQSGWFLTGKKWVVGGQTISGPFQWVGTVDQYFAAVFMPDAPADAALVTLHSQVDIPKNLDKADEAGKDKASVLGIAVGNPKGITHERLFVGPKAVDVLEGTQAQPNGPDLRQILDFGFFGFISRPLFITLKWIHGHMIPNWGWAIAFLTLSINLIMLPLRISQIKSSLKMQKIQPQVKAITDKYKRYSITDPKRAEMQKEMSALYKREGVNPVGGCFPLLIQMPFLLAFYSVLGNAIELRQANWLWIHDLSAADPLHLLPVVIIITMFVSQQSAPQPGMDPAQQKLLKFMTPAMMGLVSWNLASGVGVYWAITNILGWIQQLVINQTEFGKQMRKRRKR